VLDTEIFEFKTGLATDKGLQRNTSRTSTRAQNKLRKIMFILTLAVKQERGVSEVVHFVVTENKMLPVLESSYLILFNVTFI
jgi:hypothetical protein